MKAIEVAKLINVSSRKLYNLIKNNQIPYVKLGESCFRFVKSDVEKWIKEESGSFFDQDNAHSNEVQNALESDGDGSHLNANPKVKG